MAERVDLDVVAKQVGTYAPDGWVREVVGAMVAELRELRQDQENWFAYLRWRGEQDDKEQQRELEWRRERLRMIQDQHADPSTHDRSGES